MVYFRSVIPVTFGFCLDDLESLSDARDPKALFEYFVNESNADSIAKSFCVISDEQIGPDSPDKILKIQKRSKDILEVKKANVLFAADISDILSRAISDMEPECENFESLSSSAQSQINYIQKSIDDSFTIFCKVGGIHY